MSKSNLRAFIEATGHRGEEARHWEELTRRIAKRANVPLNKAATPIMETLASDKLSPLELAELDALGMNMSGVFEKICGNEFRELIESGQVNSNMLGMALTVLMATDEYQNMVETED